MKNIHSNIAIILLSIIVFITGMCFEIERTHSYLGFQNQSLKEETLETAHNNVIYIGNCTNKLITGLRDTFQRNRKGQERISLKNYAKFFTMAEILYLFLFFCNASVAICVVVQSGSIAILDYIHNQDGEK